jgi:hypothetical protein
MHMSVAGIFSSSALAPAQNFFQQRRADLQQLAQALQSGDLSAAQSAFNALTALSQTGSSTAASSTASTGSASSSSSGPFRNPQLAQDFTAIGTALQSGDLAGAQQAFATFQQDLQNVQASGGHFRRHHHHGGNGQNSSASSSPEIILNLGNTSGSPEQINLNFSNNGGNGEQLTIGISNGSGSPEQITVNLGANSAPPEIILNLSRGSTSTQPTTTQVPASGGQLSVTA